MIVLAFDISSKNTGWAVGDINHGIEDSGSFKSNKFCDVYKGFSELIELWKPELIVSAKPTRFYAVIRKQSEITGVLLLLAERKGIKVNKDLVDSACKKTVIGSGKATKEDIKKHFSVDCEDEADAMMMWTYIQIKNG